MSLIRFWVIVLGVLWVVGVGWREFVARGEAGAYRSAYDRTPACTGSFRRRYECRSARIIGAENALFFSWGKRIAVVFLPPLALIYLFGKYARRRDQIEAERIRRARLARAREKA